MLLFKIMDLFLEHNEVVEEYGITCPFTHSNKEQTEVHRPCFQVVFVIHLKNLRTHPLSIHHTWGVAIDGRILAYHHIRKHLLDAIHDLCCRHPVLRNIMPQLVFHEVSIVRSA